MTTTIHSSVIRGVEAIPVEVRVTRRGDAGHAQLVWRTFPEMSRPETAIRVRSALANMRDVAGLFEVDCDVPAGCSAACLDLPIAVGVLCEARAKAQRDALLGAIAPPNRCTFVGELGLGGELRSTRGALAHVRAAAAAGRKIVLPSAGCVAAHLVPGATALEAGDLAEVAAFLYGVAALPRVQVQVPQGPAHEHEHDLADVAGCVRAKRALEIAAAGGHSVLLVGSPGRGKTMLAARLPGLLPALSAKEQLEVATIRDVAGFPPTLVHSHLRPFRAPHYTCSEAATLGGGVAAARPGEVTLAHRGVLLLDELPEWRVNTLTQVGQVLAAGHRRVVMSARDSIYLPARPEVVVGAQNPCPCGYFGAASQRACRCTEAQRASYRKRTLSFGLRFELVVALDADDASPELPRTSSAAVRERVAVAREVLRDALAAGVRGVAQTIAALGGGRPQTEADVEEARSFSAAGL